MTVFELASALAEAIENNQGDKEVKLTFQHKGFSYFSLVEKVDKRFSDYPNVVFLDGDLEEIL